VVNILTGSAAAIGQMRFLAVIEEPPVIERILDQIGEWCPSPPPRAPPAEQEWPKGC
jgi:hypothetical protein